VAPASLAAPSGLSAAALSATSVRLDWTDNSNHETAFAVERRALPYGTFGLVVTAPAESRTAIDSTARPGTAYEYRVRASSGGTYSSYSNAAAVTTPRVPPAAPSALTAQYLAASRIIRLTWRDNSADEEGFHVQYSYMGSGFVDPSPATVGANVTSYSSVAYPPSGLYWIRVRSFAGGLYSAWSNLAPVTVPADVPPPKGPLEPLTSQ
jgi:titin